MKQKGFTLVEILVTLAVGSVLLVGALLTVQQTLVSTGRSRSQVVVLDDVHRAALQIKKDIQAYQTANLTDPVTFNWTDQTGYAPEDERDHYSTYSLSDTELLRTSDNITRILARNIEFLSFSENVTGDGTYIDVVITATSSTFPPRSETLSFSVLRRTGEVE